MRSPETLLIVPSYPEHTYSQTGGGEGATEIIGTGRHHAAVSEAYDMPDLETLALETLVEQERKYGNSGQHIQKSKDDLEALKTANEDLRLSREASSLDDNLWGQYIDGRKYAMHQSADFNDFMDGHSELAPSAEADMSPMKALEEIVSIEADYYHPEKGMTSPAQKARVEALNSYLDSQDAGSALTNEQLQTHRAVLKNNIIMTNLDYNPAQMTPPTPEIAQVSVSALEEVAPPTPVIVQVGIQALGAAGVVAPVAVQNRRPSPSADPVESARLRQRVIDEAAAKAAIQNGVQEYTYFVGNSGNGRVQIAIPTRGGNPGYNQPILDYEAKLDDQQTVRRTEIPPHLDHAPSSGSRIPAFLAAVGERGRLGPAAQNDRLAVPVGSPAHSMRRHNAPVPPAVSAIFGNTAGSVRKQWANKPPRRSVRQVMQDLRRGQVKKPRVRAAR